MAYLCGAPAATRMLLQSLRRLLARNGTRTDLLQLHHVKLTGVDVDERVFLLVLRIEDFGLNESNATVVWFPILLLLIMV